VIKSTLFLTVHFLEAKMSRYMSNASTETAMHALSCFYEIWLQHKKGASTPYPTNVLTAKSTVRH